jgi:hypothetical protein
MLNINFYPDHDTEYLNNEAKSYESIWTNNKEKIVNSYKEVTGLEFQENIINAIIFKKGIPRSHPLCFRAGESEDIKLATMIHELGHRLMVGNDIKLKFSDKNNSSLKSQEIHEALYLFLYDVWKLVVDENFASRHMEREKGLKRDLYRKAWENITSLSKGEKSNKLNVLLNQ